MNESEHELLNQLRALEARMASGSAPGSGPSLVTIFEDIDRLGARLGTSAAPELRHYLAKKSYRKARIWLEGGDPEAGACPH
jgi:hypothetical protein